MFWYRWSWKTKTLSKKEIEKMKKIMKKVPLIAAKNDTYHSWESKEADDEFEDKIKKI
jgi:hypothetical protein